MKFQQQLFRTLFFLFLLMCLLSGITGVVQELPVRAAPLSANALDVIINEVAWAGTKASPFDEWIELYNSTGAMIDLTNWRIEAADGDPSISLSGTITAGGYLLLERGSQNVTNVAGLVYNSGLLSDSGETLFLLDDTSSVIDTVNSNGGAWPSVGGAPNFPSMERTAVISDSDFAWVTFDNTTFIAKDAGGNDIYGTPGSANSQPNVTPTFTPTATATATATSTNTSTATPSGTVTPTRTNTPGLCTAGAAPSSILINEIAWAGTGASSSDQWIELYNPTSTLINLNNWKLRAVDGTPNITLSNFDLLPGQYYLVAHSATTFSDVTANQIFTGAIGTFNEVLQLYNASGICVDTANSNSGAWPAGNSSTHATMERSGIVHDSDTAWITNANSASWLKHDSRGTGSTNYLIHGTPGYGNWAFTVTATPSPIRTSTRVPTKFHTSTPIPAPPSPLVAINEFVPRPGHDWNNDGIVNTGDEYIEVLNHGVIDVNLSGYSLDDEVNIGSSPFSLPAVTLKPGQRMVFYESQTNIHLDDGGDGVRLIKPNGQLADAYNYPIAEYPDQAYCRLPDNGGLDDWNTNCYPTPGLPNALNAALAPPVAGINSVERACPIADNLPLDFVWAECPSFGNIWSPFYRDATGLFGEKFIPNNNSKWDSYVD